MTFLAGAAVGAGSVVFVQVCFVAGVCWAWPKGWRRAKRQYIEAFGLDWSDE